MKLQRLTPTSLDEVITHSLSLAFCYISLKIHRYLFIKTIWSELSCLRKHSNGQRHMATGFNTNFHFGGARVGTNKGLKLHCTLVLSPYLDKLDQGYPTEYLFHTWHLKFFDLRARIPSNTATTQFHRFRSLVFVASIFRLLASLAACKQLQSTKQKKENTIIKNVDRKSVV